MIRRYQGTASGAGGLYKGRRVALSCHKGLGLLGSGTGWDTVGALRHLSIVLSASEASSSTKAESRHPPSERCGGTPPRPVPFPRGWESCWCRSRPRAMSFSAARQPRGCPVYTWGDPYTRPPSHCPPATPARTTFPEVLGGPQGRGRCTVGGRGQHVPPLSANAEPFGEVTCRCLALLCALGAVGAQCGQAARTGQVGVGFAEEPAGS